MVLQMEKTASFSWDYVESNFARNYILSGNPD